MGNLIYIISQIWQNKKGHVSILADSLKLKLFTKLQRFNMPSSYRFVRIKALSQFFKLLILLFLIIQYQPVYSQFLGAGNAAYLNGTNAYLDISSLAFDGAIYANWTAEFWFKPASVQNDPGHVSLMGVNTSSGGNEFLVLMGKDGVQDGKVYVYVDGETYNGGNVLSGFDDLRDGEAHHLALTYVNSSRVISLYIDGNLNSWYTLSSTLNLATNDFWTLGGEYDSGPTIGDYFTGSFDNFRFYNYEKNALQIRKDKRVNITQSSSGSLLCAFNFDELINNRTFLDVSPNDHYATFKGGINHIVSEFTIGNGASDIKTVNSNTTVNFSTNVGLSAQIVDLYGSSDKDIVPAKFTINGDYKAPNGWDIAGNNIWIVEEYSAYPQTKIKYTFTVDEDLTSKDLNLAGYKVYRRSLNYGAGWSEWGEVKGVYTAYNKIEISAITNTFGEFMIAKAKVGSYNGNANAFPGTIQAEEFDYGGEGIGYHDTTPGNTGQQFRNNEDVDIETCSDNGGGYDIGYIENDEWLEYTVTVNTTQYYTFIARAASIYSATSFMLQFDGADAKECVVPNTGGWQNWEDVNFGYKYLTVGTYKMRIKVLKGNFNLNYFKVVSGITGVDDEKTIPTEFKLSQNYPNPFNPSTVIQYSIPAFAAAGAQHLNLAVFDMLGNKIATLVNENKPAGNYEFTFNAKELGSGVYFYKITVGNYIETKKMLLLK